VAIAAQHILSDRAELLEVLERSQLQSPDVRGTLDATSALCRRLQNEAEARSCMAELIDRIELHGDGIRVTLHIQIPCWQAGVRTSSLLGLTRFVLITMKRRGVETRIVFAAGNEPPRKVDPALLKAVVSGATSGWDCVEAIAILARRRF